MEQETIVETPKRITKVKFLLTIFWNQTATPVSLQMSIDLHSHFSYFWSDQKKESEVVLEIFPFDSVSQIKLTENNTSSLINNTLYICSLHIYNEE